MTVAFQLRRASGEREQEEFDRRPKLRCDVTLDGLQRLVERRECGVVGVQGEARASSARASS